MISTAIQQLVNYGLDTGLILPDDEIYIRNQLLMTMQLDDFTAPEGEVCYTDLESILKTLVDDAVARGVCADNSTARDLFDTKLMGVLTPRPSIVRANFEERYENEGPQAATDWFYKFSQDTDYIRRYRIKRDLKWVTKTPYGDLDITINLSKPEKDPKAIAAAKLKWYNCWNRSTERRRMRQLTFKKIYLKYVILSVLLFFVSVVLGFLLSDLFVFIIGVLVAAILLIPIRSFWKIEKSGAYSFKNGEIVNVEMRIKTSRFVPPTVSKILRIQKEIVLEVEFEDSDGLRLIVPQMDYALFY